MAVLSTLVLPRGCGSISLLLQTFHLLFHHGFMQLHIDRPPHEVRLIISKYHHLLDPLVLLLLHPLHLIFSQPILILLYIEIWHPDYLIRFRLGHHHRLHADLEILGRIHRL